VSEINVAQPGRSQVAAGCTCTSASAETTCREARRWGHLHRRDGDQTLPIWIFTNLTRPNQAPVVNVVAVLLVLISVIPIWLAQRLSEGTVRGAGAGAVAAR
jgi:hypothetical protein